MLGFVDIKELRDAFGNAFSLDDLERIVRTAERATDGHCSSRQPAIGRLRVDRMGETDSRLEELLKAATRYNPGNPRLRAVLEALRPFASPAPEHGSDGLLSDGLALQQASEYEQALSAFERAVELAGQEGNRYNEARAFSLAGSILRQLGPSGSDLSIRAGADRLGLAGQCPLRISILRDLAEIYRVSGRAGDAVPIYQQLLELNSKHGRSEDVASTLQSFARLSVEAGDEKAGASQFRSAAELWGQLGDPGSQGLATLELAGVLLRMGDIVSAEPRFVERWTWQGAPPRRPRSHRLVEPGGDRIPAGRLRHGGGTLS